LSDFRENIDGTELTIVTE